MTTKSEFLKQNEEYIQKEFNEITTSASEALAKDGAYHATYNFDCSYGITKRTAELLIEKYQTDGWEVSIEMSHINANRFAITIS
tara:strand:- start:196 stop:450 length:255 start_codon:yes stop_codon:yes gene_type:complete